MDGLQLEGFLLKWTLWLVTGLQGGHIILCSRSNTGMAQGKLEDPSRWCIKWKGEESGTNSMDFVGSQMAKIEQQLSQSADHVEII